MDMKKSFLLVLFLGVSPVAYISAEVDDPACPIVVNSDSESIDPSCPIVGDVDAGAMDPSCPIVVNAEEIEEVDIYEPSASNYMSFMVELVGVGFFNKFRSEKF